MGAARVQCWLSCWGRLGVGEFVLADPDRAEKTNLPRLIGARRCDAILPAWLPRVVATRLRSTKVRMAARNIRRANPKARIEVLARDFLDDDVATRFTDCDFLFLAADTMGARLLFNAIIHQYGIPGIQVGAKIPVAENGVVGNVFCVSRMVTPEQGCLWCNGLISVGKPAGRGGTGGDPAGICVRGRPGCRGAERGDHERGGGARMPRTISYSTLPV